MEDFSFPTMSTDQDSHCQLPFPHFATSPIWFLSSGHQKTEGQLRRSFSSVDEATKVVTKFSSASLSDDEGERKPRFLNKEEKMDMLWEDFNEELCQWKRGKDELAAGESDTEFGCVQVLGVSRSGGRLLHHRRPSMVMMLKVLKKLFLIQKTGSTKRCKHSDN